MESLEIDRAFAITALTNAVRKAVASGLTAEELAELVPQIHGIESAKLKAQKARAAAKKGAGK